MHALEIDIVMFPWVFIQNLPFPITQPAGGSDERWDAEKIDMLTMLVILVNTKKSVVHFKGFLAVS